MTVSQQNSTTCTVTLNAQGQGYCTIAASAVQASSNGATMTISASFAGDGTLNTASSNTVKIPLYTRDPDTLGTPSFNYADGQGDGNFYGTSSSNGLNNGQSVTVTYCLYYGGYCYISQGYGGTATGTDTNGSWATSYAQYLWWEPNGYGTEAQASEPDYYGPTLTSLWNTNL